VAALREDDEAAQLAEIFGQLAHHDDLGSAGAGYCQGDFGMSPFPAIDAAVLDRFYASDPLAAETDSKLAFTRCWESSSRGGHVGPLGPLFLVPTPWA